MQVCGFIPSAFTYFSAEQLVRDVAFKCAFCLECAESEGPSVSNKICSAGKRSGPGPHAPLCVAAGEELRNTQTVNRKAPAAVGRKYVEKYINIYISVVGKRKSGDS